MSARTRSAPASSWACRCNPVAPAPRSDPLIIHATCVAVQGRALLIQGASGSGKSGLALQLLAMGAGLVADDRVALRDTGSAILAEAPATIRGLIEARGLGLLRAEPQSPCAVAYLLDLDRVETARLPPPRSTRLMGQSVPLLFRVDALHFPAALFRLLADGRHDTP